MNSIWRMQNATFKSNAELQSNIRLDQSHIQQNPHLIKICQI